VIGIRNLGPVANAGKNGWHTYQVRINFDLIAEFIHRRSDGLATCLRRAAAAVAREKEK